MAAPMTEMTQNMFQEGLYQVYVRDTPPSPPQDQVPADNEELYDVRIHRWFGTVVNTRVLVAGAVQIISALACLLFTVTHACVTYNCSVSMVTPVWSSLFYLAAGCLAMEVQKRANQLKVITLMGLNIFSLLFGFSALLANSVSSKEPVTLTTKEQRAGSNVAKGGSIAFSVQCFLASVYIIFLSWKGLHRYSPTSIKAYSRVSESAEGVQPSVVVNGERLDVVEGFKYLEVHGDDHIWQESRYINTKPQDQDETNGPLLEQEDQNL